MELTELLVVNDWELLVDGIEVVCEVDEEIADEPEVCELVVVFVVVVVLFGLLETASNAIAAATTRTMTITIAITGLAIPRVRE